MPARRDGSAFLAAVLFDLYGTLVPFGTSGMAERDTVGREMGRDLGVDGAALAEAIRVSFDARARGLTGSIYDTVRTLAEGLGGSPTAATVVHATERRLALTRSQLSAHQEALPVLDALRAAGLKTALVSDCSAETPLVLGSSALASRFDALSFSCMLGVRKPDPAIYRQALTQLALTPQECVFVGDGGGRELSGAAALGMHAIRLRRPDDDPASRHDDDAGFSGDEVASLGELLRVPRIASRIGGSRA